MSNYLAIATVTATLQRLLQDSIQRDVDGARVTAIRPNGIGSGTPESGVNLFLYQVNYNTALKNTEMQGLRSKTHPGRRQSALDLSYVFSFYGNEGELEPQRLLGSVVRTLSDKATLDTKMFRETITDSSLGYLTDSDLAYQDQQMTITPLDLDLEALSKVWSVFFQAPYLLSLAYSVRAVVIDGEETAQRALPVREPQFGVMPFPHQPVVERVQAEAGARAPILANSKILIQGQRLKGPWKTQVRLGKTVMNAREVSDGQIMVELSDVPAAQLRSGSQTLQVLHPAFGLLGGNRNRPAIASNGFPVILRPTILELSASQLDDQGEGLYSGQVNVQVDLSIAPGQTVVLALNQWSIDNPTAYLFAAAPLEQLSQRVSFPIWKVKPGSYLARLQVDGAESLLEVDRDASSKTFNWFERPRIEIG